MAKALATGTDLWGLKVEKVDPVLYIECDMTKESALHRIQKLGFSGGTGDFFFAYPGFDVVNPNSSSDSADIYLELQALHKRRAYKVVFIDSLRTLHMLPEHSSDTVNRVYSALERLFPGATKVIVHHDRKIVPEIAALTGEEKEAVSVESFSGSQAWGNHAAVGIKVHKRTTKEISLIHTKSQVGEQQPNLMLHVDEGIFVQARAGKGDVAAFLATLPGGLTMAEIDRRIAGHFKVGLRTATTRRLELSGSSDPLTD